MKVYCINLKRRPDRREKIEKEFQREGLENVEFFTATDGCEHSRMKRGECGCTDSHIRVWKDIVAKGHPWALVFEDDARLVEGFKEKLDEIMSELPGDWDYLNLGTFPILKLPFEHVSTRLTRGSSMTAHCYLVSQSGARHVKHWKVAHTHFAWDLQILRTPMNMFYVEEPLAYQNIKGHPLLGYFYSTINGDLGLFSRSIDIDYCIRAEWPWLLYFILVTLVCYAIF